MHACMHAGMPHFCQGRVRLNLESSRTQCDRRIVWVERIIRYGPMKEIDPLIPHG